MKLSYKQKLYFSILLVFLVFFNVGILTIATIQNSKNLNMQKETHIQQSNIIIQNLVDDINLVYDTRPSAIPSIIQQEGNYLKLNNITLQVSDENDTLLFSSFFTILEDVDFSLDAITSKIITIEDEKTFLVSTKLDEEIGSYNIVLGYSIQWFFDDWNNTILIIIALSLSFSLVISLVLYLAINKLTKPLEEIATVTNKFGEGDFSVRIVNFSNDELGKTAKNFNTMADNLAQQFDLLRASNDEKQRLIDDISHEMRTPLTAIKGYVQYLQTSSISNKEYFETLEIINKQIQRMQNLSEGILSFASLRGIDDEEVVDIKAVLSDVYNSYIIKAKAQNTNLKFIYNDNFTINANKILIESLIGNLIDNSLNATLNIKNSFVSLTLDKNKIIIKDNGVGMDNKTIENIFKPFYRADKSRSRKNGGAGLGASLCKEISDKYNIELKYHSKINEGTITYLDFTTL